MLTRFLLNFVQLGCSITGTHWRHHSHWPAHTTWRLRPQRAMWCFCLWWVQMTNNGPLRNNCWRLCWSLSMLDFDSPHNKGFALCRDMINWSDSSNLTHACSDLYYTRGFWKHWYIESYHSGSIRSAHKSVCCIHLKLPLRAVHFGPQNCMSSWFYPNMKPVQNSSSIFFHANWGHHCDKVLLDPGKILMACKKKRRLQCWHQCGLWFCLVFKLVYFSMSFENMY